MSETRLNMIDSDSLLERKRDLLMKCIPMLRELDLPIEYPYTVMQAARQKGIVGPRYVALLELLLEIEAIKYTLCSRMVPHVGEDDAGV
jgi:hypothetical protein